MKNRNNLVLIVLVIMGLALGYNFFFLTKEKQAEQRITYTSFLEKLDNNAIKKVSINGNLIKAQDSSNEVFITAFPSNDPDLLRNLKEKKVDISVSMPDSGGSGVGTFLVIGVALFLVFMIIRSIRGGGDNNQNNPAGGGNSPFSFGKSKARLQNPKDSTVTFADVAGVDEAKEDLEEMVDF